MSSASKTAAASTSSFESPYVSLDLLSYLKSGQITPFQIFSEVVVPDLLQHLCKGRKSLLAPPTGVKGNGVSITNGQDSGSITTEDDDTGHEDQYIRMLKMSEEIQEDVILIKKACGRWEQWEALVNGAMKELVLQSLDDAFKERTETLENTVRTNFLQNKLSRTHDTVSMLKKWICVPPELSSINLDSESFKRFTYSMTRKEINLRHRTINWSVQLPDVNISKRIAKTSTFNEIQAIYDSLDVTSKMCLLCFSVFPENAVIKKKVLVHWWIGEGFIEYSPGCSEGDKSIDKIANGFFEELLKKGIIEPVYKKQRPSADSFKMQPSVRYAVIMLADRTGFINFDANGNPTTNFSRSRRACLVKTEEGFSSSLQEMTFSSFHLKQENVWTLFNVSEHRLDFKLDWFAKMKYARVLQLGRWEGSAKHLIEVEDGEFLKGLKRMKHLRYLSLRGVSRITELPNSICGLINLRILNLNGCHDLEKLPDGIGSLKKLTHLDMYECYLISHMPEGIALLSELQILKGFVIGKPRPGVSYCQLEDLTKLKSLKKLSIHVDRNSGTVKRELSALARFDKLRSLSISWSRIYDSSIPRRLIQVQGMISKTKRLVSRKKLAMQFSGSSPIQTSELPVSLEKLDLHYFPCAKLSEWFSAEKLKNLKKLYIRGGKLSDLREDVYSSWAVKALRLKFLSELRMDWRELQELFPELIYLEKCKCPRLCFFPCDECGIWKNN